MKTKIAVANLETIAHEQLLPFNGKPLTLMVSGGSILRILEGDRIKELDKAQWSVYFADERLVPLSDKDSNFKCAEAFLQGVGKVVPMNTALPHSEMVEDYKEKLQNAKFDLAILGIGEDGHVASIFPDSPIIDSADIVTIITDSPKPPAERITITPRMLTMIKKIVFLVPRLPNGLLKSVDEPHFSILSRLNTDILIVTAEPLGTPQ
ncbi:6-phosphogluconolactonase [Nematocida sp. AWRm77]|nr:6-phosphogluconolactonase [Nematocida sp. AWRm77]